MPPDDFIWLGPGSSPITTATVCSFPPKVIAVDPGEPSGWAAFDGEGAITMESHFVVGMVQSQRPQTVICERLAPGAVRIMDDAPHRVAGALQALKPDIIWQPPSAARVARKWFKLKRGLIRSEHAKDALGHLVYWLVTQRG